MEVIFSTIEIHVPRIRPSVYMKRWWLKELTQLHARTRALGKQSYHAQLSDSTHPDHKAHRRARNDYAKLIDSSKKDCRDDFVIKTEDKTMYTINELTEAASTGIST